MIRYAGLFIVLFLGMISVNAQTSVATLKYDLEAADSVSWINFETRHQGTGSSGSYFSRTDSLKPYSIGYKDLFPDSCTGKNLRIRYSMMIRSQRLHPNGSIVLSVLHNDSTVYWSSKKVVTTVKGQWKNNSGEIIVPANVTLIPHRLAFFVWNEDGRFAIDVDDIELEFSEEKLPTFIPSGFKRSDNNSGWVTVTSGKFFRLLYEKFDGTIRITGREQDTVFRSVSLYNSYTSDSLLEEEWSTRFNQLPDSVTEEGKYFQFICRTDLGETVLSFFMEKDLPELHIGLRSVFKINARVHRQSLVMDYGLPLREVYRQNTLTDSVNFKKEYWLGNGGLRIGNESQNFLIYHPEKLSSIQLDSEKGIIYLNSDWECDHPLLHWPQLEKNRNHYIDRSASVYSSGDEITSAFSLFALDAPVIVPRFMKNPRGFLSSMLWTEHADYSDLQTSRAVYFGSDSINLPENSTGGFINHGIPVTKSVFYSNPQKQMNSTRAGFVKSQVLSVSGNKEFLGFLHLLHESGNEICLHTPDPFTTTREMLIESLKQMKLEFDPITWIDHGYDNSSQSNREDLVCDGLDSVSSHYAYDEWKKYGLKYFWNCFYEDTPAFSHFGFNAFFDVPYKGFGDCFPVPDKWIHPTRSYDLIHWPTTFTLDPSESNLWNYYFNDTRLKDLIDSRSNVIIHCYPSRIDSLNTFYTRTGKGFNIGEEFNNALIKLSHLRDDGNLFLSTISEKMGYLLSVDSVRYQVLRDGGIRLTNKSGRNLFGLSFCTSGKEVSVSGKNISSKISAGERIFWFDLMKDESVKISIQ